MQKSYYFYFLFFSEVHKTYIIRNTKFEILFLSYSTLYMTTNRFSLHEWFMRRFDFTNRFHAISILQKITPSDKPVVNDNVQSTSAPLVEDLYPSAFLFDDGTKTSAGNNGSGAGAAVPAVNPAPEGSGNGGKPGSVDAGTRPHYQEGFKNKFFNMVFAVSTFYY